jgi:prolyl 4-hydroxylase
MQKFNSELTKWMRDNLINGVRDVQLLADAKKAGWAEDVIHSSMQAALVVLKVNPVVTMHKEKIQAQFSQAQPSKQGMNLQKSNEVIANAPIPEPNLENSPTYIDTFDRRVYIGAVMNLPRVVVFNNLLSEKECDELIALSEPKLSRSTTVNSSTGTFEVHDARTSEGTYFMLGENELCQRIERRIAELVRWPVDNGVGLQILRYSNGATYTPHYDYFDPAAPGSATILKTGGNRVGTIVMYLQAPEKGGATTFPDVGFEVSPVKGSAVFFSYANPHPSSKSLHSGAPVTQGQKYVATKWLREKAYR